MTINEGSLVIQDELEPKEFVARVNDRDDYDPTIHVIPDFPERRFGLYYHTGEAGSGEVIKTVIENVNFKNRYDKVSQREIANWFLTYDEAFTLLTWVNSYKWERTETNVTLEWIEETGKPMMEDSGFGEEGLIFQYKTESGNSQTVHINSIYKNEIQQMVNFK